MLLLVFDERIAAHPGDVRRRTPGLGTPMGIAGVTPVMAFFIGKATSGMARPNRGNTCPRTTLRAGYRESKEGASKEGASAKQ